MKMKCRKSITHRNNKKVNKKRISIQKMEFNRK